MRRQSNPATLEIPLVEGATIAGLSRSAVYVATRAGEIAGARKVGGKLWVAPRSSFEALRDRIRTARQAAR
jgi:hypothetical protein